ncbi:hypothetical protein J6590_011237 [Homalodisca vitripennis]|nr:hypothetical protein J6590_011237 [Homalodisca vitripennis]
MASGLTEYSVWVKLGGKGQVLSRSLEEECLAGLPYVWGSYSLYHCGSRLDLWFHLTYHRLVTEVIHRFLQYPILHLGSIYGNHKEGNSRGIKARMFASQSTDNEKLPHHHNIVSYTNFKAFLVPRSESLILKQQHVNYDSMPSFLPTYHPLAMETKDKQTGKIFSTSAGATPLEKGTTSIYRHDPEVEVYRINARPSNLTPAIAPLLNSVRELSVQPALFLQTENKFKREQNFLLLPNLKTQNRIILCKRFPQPGKNFNATTIASTRSARFNWKIARSPWFTGDRWRCCRTLAPRSGARQCHTSCRQGYTEYRNRLRTRKKLACRTTAADVEMTREADRASEDMTKEDMIKKKAEEEVNIECYCPGGYAESLLLEKVI